MNDSLREIRVQGTRGAIALVEKKLEDPELKPGERPMWEATLARLKNDLIELQQV